MQVKEIRAWSGLFRHRPDQGRKPGPQRLKIGVQYRHGRALLIVVQQGVIGRGKAGLIPGKAAVVRHQLFQIGGKGREVAFLLGLVPNGVRLGAQACIVHVFVHGNTGGILIGVPEHLHPAAERGVHVPAVFPQGLQQFLRSGIDQELVACFPQHAHGFAPGGRGRGRRAGRAVQGEHPHGVTVCVHGFFQDVQFGNGVGKRHESLPLFTIFFIIAHLCRLWKGIPMRPGKRSLSGHPCIVKPVPCACALAFKNAIMSNDASI